MPFVYILLCSDNSFYVGHTNNPSAREQAHNAEPRSDDPAD
ncbi:MAG: hypothetical protein EHM55_05560 [Acidobacteria bacterium]|nr:MAG: hypothetical protein EHM55_05560 [Acidobacteriota bacterium]